MERVKVRGRDEVFLVAHVYPSLEIVDLVPLGREHIVEHVIFEMLEVVDAESEAA